MVNQGNPSLQQVKTRLPGDTRALRHTPRDYMVQVVVGRDGEAGDNPRHPLCCQ